MTEKEWDITSRESLTSAVSEVLKLLAGTKITSSVLALSGELGAGKTTFTQELAKQIGISEVVSSPTFVVMKEYEINYLSWQRLIHIDAYRIESEKEMEVLDFASYLNNENNLICIEWPEKIAKLIPSSAFRLNFELSENKRTLKLSYEQ